MYESGSESKLSVSNFMILTQTLHRTCNFIHSSDLL